MSSAYIVQDAAADAEAQVVNASTGTTISRGEAQSTSGTGNAAAKDFGIAQSAGNAAVQNTGALALGGQNNNYTGATVTAGYDAAAFNNALQSVGNNLSSAVNAQAATGKAQLATVLENLTSLAESKQTDGVSGLSKTALWALAIAGAVLITWLLHRK